ncbi:hypothetical protein XELAEV_18041500mg [Xenopus laevis]|uniref:Uncharacterized protein n=1 Tax=Xenopus laevis TaxID=8355 RepID=A0A974C2L5_XENLA|nr:hypothetical protein XELAEV_18041500mg [Xenopus laevis]
MDSRPVAVSGGAQAENRTLQTCHICTCIFWKSCVASFLIFLFMLSTHNYEKIRKSWTSLRAHRAIGNISPLQNIISAHYVNREPISVRIIAIRHVDKVKELYCWFYFEFRKGYTPVRAHTDIPSDQFGLPYCAVVVLYKEPLFCFSHYISIHAMSMGKTDGVPVFKIKNRELLSFSANFILCISIMFGICSNVLQFIQAMEMYRLLGGT